MRLNRFVPTPRGEISRASFAIRQDFLPSLDVFGNDDDAFLASWEDLHRGGHGVWYNNPRPDRFGSIYSDLIAAGPVKEGEALGRTEAGGGDTDDEGSGHGEDGDQPPAPGV